MPHDRGWTKQEHQQRFFFSFFSEISFLIFEVKCSSCIFILISLILFFIFQPTFEHVLLNMSLSLSFLISFYCFFSSVWNTLFLAAECALPLKTCFVYFSKRSEIFGLCFYIVQSCNTVWQQKFYVMFSNHSSYVLIFFLLPGHR